MVLKTVKEVPGISYNELGRLTNLSNGVITHYILQLIECGELVKFGNGRPKYFHSKISKKDRKIIAMLRNQTNKDIVKLLVKSETELSAGDISKKIRKSRSTVSVSLKKLQKNNLIEREIMNKKIKITSDIGYQVTDRNFFGKYFDMHNI